MIFTDPLNSWAIRNCGLLLLRSLIDSLFGTSESKAVTEAGWDGRSIRLSYERYPSLPDLLLKLLDTETSGSDQSTAPAIGAVESVFPALDIIRRAGPPSARRNEIYKLVSLHLGSRLWHVREIAARTICTLLLHQHWLRDILELLSMSGESSNRIHGTLMVVRFLLERRLLLHQGSATGELYYEDLNKSADRLCRRTDRYLCCTSKSRTSNLPTTQSGGGQSRLCRNLQYFRKDPTDDASESRGYGAQETLPGCDRRTYH